VVAGDGVAWAWTAVEVTGAYDLSRRADLARSTPAQRLDWALGEQATYLKRLLAVRPGEVVALRWVRSEPGRLRLWLVARTSASVPETAAARAVQLAEQVAAVPVHVLAAPVADPAAAQAVRAARWPGSATMPMSGRWWRCCCCSMRYGDVAGSRTSW